MCDLSFSSASFTNVGPLAFGGDVQNWAIFSVDFSFDVYEMSFHNSLDYFQLKIYFIRYKLIIFTVVFLQLHMSCSNQILHRLAFAMKIIYIGNMSLIFIDNHKVNINVQKALKIQVVKS